LSQLVPELLLFAPCEKTIVDNAGTLSLVSILQGVAVDIPESEPRENAVVPMKWEIVTLWSRSQEDSGPTGDLVEWQQTCELRRGDQAISRSQIRFRMDADRHQNIVTHFGFPAEANGRYMLVLILQQMPDGTKSELKRFPLSSTIRIIPKPS
jgi:hypothetical protein